jgi:hypothetical protein
MVVKNAKVIDLHDGGSTPDGAVPSIRVLEAADDQLLSTRGCLSRIKDELGLDTDLELGGHGWHPAYP